LWKTRSLRKTRPVWEKAGEMDMAKPRWIGLPLLRRHRQEAETLG
jgi:hypothetical protein